MLCKKKNYYQCCFLFCFRLCQRWWIVYSSISKRTFFRRSSQNLYRRNNFSSWPSSQGKLFFFLFAVLVSRLTIQIVSVFRLQFLFYSPIWIVAQKLCGRRHFLNFFVRSVYAKIFSHRFTGEFCEFYLTPVFYIHHLSLVNFLHSI